MWSNAPSQFSMKLPARRYATGIGRVRVACSIRWVDVISPSPLGCSEPMDERNTALPGFARSSASRIAAIVRFWSGSPGAGAKSGGIIENTPSAPANAFASPAASSYADGTSSTPRSGQTFAFSGFRTTPRTVLPAASRFSATAPPTLPVIPITVNIPVHLIYK
jgi:hypothetical protein